MSAGYSADMEKYNAAAILGYTVLRYSTQMVKNGEAIRDITKVCGDKAKTELDKLRDSTTITNTGQAEIKNRVGDAFPKKRPC